MVIIPPPPHTYNLVDSVAIPGAAYGMGPAGISLDNLACVGTEERILDCPFPDNVFCTHAEDAGVDCNENCKWRQAIIIPVDYKRERERAISYYPTVTSHISGPNLSSVAPTLKRKVLKTGFWYNLILSNRCHMYLYNSFMFFKLSHCSPLYSW